MEKQQQQQKPLPEWKRKQLEKQQALEIEQENEYYQRIINAPPQATKFPPMDIMWYPVEDKPEEGRALKTTTYTTPKEFEDYLVSETQLQPSRFRYSIGYDAAIKRDLWLTSTSLPHLTKKKLSLFTGEPIFKLPKGNLSQRAVLNILANAPPGHNLLCGLPKELIGSLNRFVPPQAPVVLRATEMKVADRSDLASGSTLQYFDLLVSIWLRVDESEPIKSFTFTLGRYDRTFKSTDGEWKDEMCSQYGGIRIDYIDPTSKIAEYRFDFYRLINNHPSAGQDGAELRLKINYEKGYTLSCTHRDTAYDDFINAVCFTSDSLIQVKGDKWMRAEEIRVGDYVRSDAEDPTKFAKVEGVIVTQLDGWKDIVTLSEHCKVTKGHPIFQKNITNNNNNDSYNKEKEGKWSRADEVKEPKKEWVDKLFNFELERPYNTVIAFGGIECGTVGHTFAGMGQSQSAKVNEKLWGDSYWTTTRLRLQAGASPKVKLITKSA